MPAGFLELDDARIYHEVDGTGPAVVLIHAGVANLRMWDPQVEDLARDHRVIRYDTRGFGRTETGEVEYSNRADLAALLDHLEEEAAHVVGLSRGGVIALDFALEHPGRVRTLTVAAGGISGFDPPVEAPAEFRARGDALYEAKEWEALADHESAYWADGPGQPDHRVPEVRRLVRGWLLDHYRAGKASGRPIPLSPPAVERLADLTAPLLVMLGLRDDPGTTAAMRHLASSVPGARLVEHDTAHMINLEEPARFDALLREHLEVHRGTG